MGLERELIYAEIKVIRRVCAPKENFNAFLSYFQDLSVSIMARCRVVQTDKADSADVG
jgi:hypothetical protein